MAGSTKPRQGTISTHYFSTMTLTMMQLFLVSLAVTFAVCSAWVSPNNSPPTKRASSSNICTHDRRQFVASLITVGSATPLLVSASPALAAAASQEQKDKEKIVKGYNRLQYLLDNWEDETTVCNIGQEVGDANFMFVFVGICVCHTYCHCQETYSQYCIDCVGRQLLVTNVNVHP